MKVITIREKGTNKLLAFGPDDGMYMPGVPIGATKGLEDSYEAVQQEFVRGLPPKKTADELAKEQALANLDLLLADPVVVDRLKLSLGIK